MSVEKDFEDVLRSVLAPDPDGDMVTWLERNVKNIPYSPNPGPFRIESTPYLAPILRELQNPETETIVVPANVQSGKTSLLELWSTFIPARAPGPTLLLRDNDPNAQDWQQTRLRPIWESTPSTYGKINNQDKSKWSATHFERSITWVLGAHNVKNLQGRSIRYLGGDECWLWPKGHIAEALARRTAFTWQGKSLFVSQGGYEGDDFTALFNATDRREWMFKCPHCTERQPFEWSQIKYPEGAKKDGQWNYDMVRENTTYACKKCDHRFLDRNSVRAEMIKDAEYVPLNPNAPKGRVGFHFNALTMLWGLSWGDLAVECIEAAQAFEETGDETKRREFKQKRLAIAWSDEPDDEGGEILPSGYMMEQEWQEEGANVDGRATAPPFDEATKAKHTFLPTRFMSVDVQRKGFFYVVRSWSIDGKSRLIRWQYLDTWEQVRDEQKRLKVSDMFVFVDSGDGPNVDDVYRHCAMFGWNATKGSGNAEFPWRIQTPIGTKIAYRPYAPAKIIQVGKQACRLYLFSNLVLKDTLTRLRRKGDHTYPEDAGDEYRKQMQSEHRTRTETGRPIWIQVGERANHLWDCEVMGILPALMAKLVGRGKNKNAAVDEKAVDKPKEETSS
jgi:phage terminase large subunit GpA-like protein